jgi:DNA-binding MarR family transcriptional regulator
MQSRRLRRDARARPDFCPIDPLPRRSPDSGPARTPPRRAGTQDLSQLFTYCISTLANTLSRGAAARYSRDYVTLVEWRIIGSLALNSPMSLRQISHRFDLDKGQSSRAVAGLLSRGMVHRSINGQDRRSVVLKLTPAGWRLYRRILDAARERSERLLGCLEARERRAFLRSFGRVMTEARAVYLNERAAPQNGRRPRAGIRKPHA